MNINLNNKERGFTIVELLIVIVVIGILAAITIVAYNGVQNRAKTSSAQSAAANVVKKAEIYNTDDTTLLPGYPAKLTDLTGAASTAMYAVTGVVAGGTLSNTSAQNAVNFYKCGVGAAAASTDVASTTVQTGVRVDYRDYVNSTNKSVTAGVTSGTVNTDAVTCFLNN